MHCNPAHGLILQSHARVLQMLLSLDQSKVQLSMSSIFHSVALSNRMLLWTLMRLLQQQGLACQRKYVMIALYGSRICFVQWHYPTSEPYLLVSNAMTKILRIVTNSTNLTNL